MDAKPQPTGMANTPLHIFYLPEPLEYAHWTLVCLKGWGRTSLHLPMLFPLPEGPSFHTHRPWNQAQESFS